MNQPGGMDASRLHFEVPEVPMHVASPQSVELPEGHAGDCDDGVGRCVAGRMHLADVLQRKLAPMPFELVNPARVDNEDLDVDDDARHVILPLWETHGIESLNTGQRAIDHTMHHAAIDGQAGVAVTQALLGGPALPAPFKPLRRPPRTNPYQRGAVALAGAALRNAVQQAVNIVKPLPGTARAIVGVVCAEGSDGKRRLAMPKGSRRAPRTLLSVAITSQRAFAARSLPLTDIELMATRSDARPSDVVLAICAGALKRDLVDYNFMPDRPQVAGVPVSLRDAGNTDPNIRVAMMMVSLATDVDDPPERLRAIKAPANAGKKLTGSFQGADPDRRSAAGRAVVDAGCGVAAWPLAAGRSAAVDRQRGDLERAGPAAPTILCGGEAGRLLPGLDPGPPHCTEHDGAEPRRRAQNRPDGLPPRDARRD